MKATIFCKTTAKGFQTYYIQVHGKEYFLFKQAFHRSNKEFFCKGVSIDKISDYSVAHSTSVRKTLDKLPCYIRYVEKEYGIAIYNKTKQRFNELKARKKFDYITEAV